MKGGFKNKNMIFNFRKIASVLSSAVMVSSTMALAAASSFPAPYVENGAADAAVVYGADAATTDLIAAVDIQSALSTELARQTANGGSSSSATTSGETAPLFTGGTKLYVNDSLSAITNVLTKSNLPNVLVAGSFSGNVDSAFAQQIDIGADPKVTFKKQPTTSDEPAYGLTTSYGSSANKKYLYNSTIIFAKEVNLSHSDSEGEDISMFGSTFTISSATTSTDLVLLKSAEKISLSSDDPTAEVTVGGETYTIEQISSSDSAATIQVTNSEGKSEIREISESASKKVNGITIAVTTADETNLKLTSTIVAGSDKVTLTDGNNVKYGENDKIIDGTLVQFEGTVNGVTTMTKLIVSVLAPTGDEDALMPGESFVDPVFGSFKVDFGGLSVADDSAAREDIVVTNSGDDRMEISFTDYSGAAGTFQFAKNLSNKAYIQAYRDDDGHNISVREGAILKQGDYVVVGNEDSGRLIRLSSVYNATETETSTHPNFADDRVEFADVFSTDTYVSSITSEGSGKVVIAGKQYDVKYWGKGGSDTSDFNVTLNYPDSTSANEIVLFPTIQTESGAKIALYKPVLVNQSDVNGEIKGNAGGTFGLKNFTGLKIPDGDTYTDFTISHWDHAVAGVVNISVDGGVTNASSFGPSHSQKLTVGQLVFNLTVATDEDAADFADPTYRNCSNCSLIRLVNPIDSNTNPSTNIDDPAIIVFEERDDNSLYEAWVITLEEGGSGDDGLGIEDVASSWDDAASWESTMASDSKISKKGDLFGTIVTIDGGDSDQKTATLSYPGEQIYANIYIGEIASSVSVTGTGSSSVTSLGNILVTDSEASSVSSKNLIVVGGSCINSVAAELLGEGACGADFESKTGVGAGSFLIETFSRTGGKVATLVAGYNAGDTTNAAKFLTTQTVDTTAGMKYTGTSATSATLVTEATTA